MNCDKHTNNSAFSTGKRVKTNSSSYVHNQSSKALEKYIPQSHQLDKNNHHMHEQSYIVLDSFSENTIPQNEAESRSKYCNPILEYSRQKNNRNHNISIENKFKSYGFENISISNNHFQQISLSYPRTPLRKNSNKFDKGRQLIEVNKKLEIQIRQTLEKIQMIKRECQQLETCNDNIIKQKVNMKVESHKQQRSLSRRQSNVTTSRKKAPESKKKINESKQLLKITEMIISLQNSLAILKLKGKKSKKNSKSVLKSKDLNLQNL